MNLPQEISDKVGFFHLPEGFSSQVSLHSFLLMKLFPFPPHPPYLNCLQTPLSYVHLITHLLQGPVTPGASIHLLEPGILAGYKESLLNMAGDIDKLV